MKVLIYVEGPSDKYALGALLKPLISEARERRISIQFLPQNGKGHVLKSVPGKAANYLHQHPRDMVIALPDLYPMACYRESPYTHGSAIELKNCLEREFNKEANEIGLSNLARKRFKAHCLKHDLESLVLAAKDQLRSRLDTKENLNGAWRNPVENQNDTKPPKRVVEELFNKYKKKEYQDTIDAPWILERANLETIVKACPQCFKPFVNDLRKIIAAGAG